MTTRFACDKVVPAPVNTSIYMTVSKSIGLMGEVTENTAGIESAEKHNTAGSYGLPNFI